MTDGLIRIRFVRVKGLAYNIVVWRGGICMPFTPTHAECITPEGTCLGQHGYGGGTLDLPMGYDRADVYIMRDGRRCELIVDLPCTKAQQDAFYVYMRKPEPYDWSAPWGFLFGGHWHRKFNSTCAAKIHMALRACNVFRWPTAKPAHEYDPADLLDVVSHLVEVPH